MCYSALVRQDLKELAEFPNHIPPISGYVEGIRQFDSAADPDRIWTMKHKTVTQPSNRNPELAARVGRALERAAESARRTARMHGTPLYFWENGRVVAKRP
jgi:hypothetical protein